MFWQSLLYNCTLLMFVYIVISVDYFGDNEELLPCMTSLSSNQTMLEIIVCEPACSQPILSNIVW